MFWRDFHFHDNFNLVSSLSPPSTCIVVYGTNHDDNFVDQEDDENLFAENDAIEDENKVEENLPLPPPKHK